MILDIHPRPEGKPSKCEVAGLEYNRAHGVGVVSVNREQYLLTVERADDVTWRLRFAKRGDGADVKTVTVWAHGRHARADCDCQDRAYRGRRCKHLQVAAMIAAGKGRRE